jgi:hypothetical protein
MTRKRLRFWLLTGLNILAGVTVSVLAFDEFSATRYLVDDGVLLSLVFSVFVLVPLILLVVYVLGRRQASARTRSHRIYARLSVAFLAVCWLVTAAPALFWGALIIAAREPWPLSLAQGPDTERARTGVAKLFGTGPAEAMSSVYFYSFNIRDGSYFVRFAYTDLSVIEQVAGRKDLVSVPLTTRNDGRFDVRAHRNRWSWWDPDEINRADALYVDRPTGEKIVGNLPRNQPVGFSRVLWVDQKTRTAYYREIEF